jgi:phage terminase large subunit-like protein
VRDLSVFERLALRPAHERERVLAEFTEEQRAALLYDWSVWRRSKQSTPDGDWRVWLILAGRGFGKTRTGAEFIREQVDSGRA